MVTPGTISPSTSGTLLLSLPSNANFVEIKGATILKTDQGSDGLSTVWSMAADRTADQRRRVKGATLQKTDQGSDGLSTLWSMAADRTADQRRRVNGATGLKELHY